jgi:hypothetical protein
LFPPSFISPHRYSVFLNFHKFISKPLSSISVFRFFAHPIILYMQPHSFTIPSTLVSTYNFSHCLSGCQKFSLHIM